MAPVQKKGRPETPGDQIGFACLQASDDAVGLHLHELHDDGDEQEYQREN